MASVNTLRLRRNTKQQQLDAANNAYTALLSGGVKSYAIGSRNLTKFDIPQLEESIAKLEREIDYLDKEIAGGKRRKAVGVIPMDT